MKRHTRRARRERGKKLVQPAQLRALLEKASPEVHAAIMLGVNGGFYAQDVSDLTFDHIDLDAAVVRMARHKTEIDRVCPLWPETVAAIRKVIDRRPKPNDESNADRVFLTAPGQQVGDCRGRQV